MTRSYGGSGRRPTRGDRPTGDAGREPQPAAEQQQAIQPVRVDLGKRAVALVIDVAAGYFIGIMVALIPFVNTFLPINATMVVYLLTRDFFFAGRGIGKNLMGLQVVDVMTGRPCDLLQSLQRNFIMLAPYVALLAVGVLLRFVTIEWLNTQMLNLITLVGTIYCLGVIPYEAYRAYSRADGLRIGDEIAGTALIEAPMDFSQIVPRE